MIGREWSLNDAIREGKRAIRSRKKDFVNVLIDRDALRVLVSNTEVVLRAIGELVSEPEARHGR